MHKRRLSKARLLQISAIVCYNKKCNNNSNFYTNFMTKTIAKKDLYRQLKTVSDDVMENGEIYTVLQYSKPAFQIMPAYLTPHKKYQKKDIERFMFKGKDSKEKNLSTTYKKFLYS